MARPAKPNRKGTSPTARAPGPAEADDRGTPEVEDVQPSEDDVVTPMKGTTMKSGASEDVATRGAEYAQKSYDQVLGATRDQVEKMSATALKAYEELSKFQRENYEAYMAASAIFAKGIETIGKTWASYTQEHMENVAQTAKALLAAKTLREAADLQNDWAKASFDKLVAEGTKVSELSVKVANEAFQPLNARMNVAVEKLFKPVTAA